MCSRHGAARYTSTAVPERNARASVRAVVQHRASNRACPPAARVPRVERMRLPPSRRACSSRRPRAWRRGVRAWGPGGRSKARIPNWLNCRHRRRAGWSWVTRRRVRAARGWSGGGELTYPRPVSTGLLQAATDSLVLLHTYTLTLRVVSYHTRYSSQSRPPSCQRVLKARGYFAG